MKNAQKKGLAAVLILAVLPIIFLTNCNIGLGTAVDTKAPGVAITYPPTNSVIRDTFIMSGTAEDETGIASVSVVLTKLPLSSGVKTAPISGTVDEAGKKWTIRVNTKNGDAYTIADGKYEAQVTVTDTVGRSTSTTSVYTIDNTRPLVVVTQPATRGEQNPWEFGSELNFMGMQYDENISGVFYINFYKQDGTFVTTYTGSNVLTDWSLDIVPGNNAYAALVEEMDNINIPEKFWYTITVEDLAYEYKNPSEPSGIEKKGNRSLHYYLWPDIIGMLITGDFSPKINALYKVDSNLTYSLSDVPSSITKEKLELVKIIEEIPQEDIEDTAAHFTIDPNNKDPMIKGDGLVPSANEDDDKSSINQLGLSGTLRFEIIKNKDGVEINGSTLKYRMLKKEDDSTWVPVARSGLIGPLESEWFFPDPEAVNTGGITLIYTHEAPSMAGVYRLELYVEDLYANEARNKFWFFTINKGAPEIVVSPDSPYVLPLVSGKFNLKVTAHDDGQVALLTVKDGSVTVFDSITPPSPPPLIDGRYKFVWDIQLPANASDGKDITYTFEVTDNKWTNRVIKTYTTDKSPPVMASLTSPSLTGTPPRALVSSTSVSVVAKAGIDSNINVMDITQARLMVTTENTAPLETDSSWQNANVSADGEGTINGSLVLPGVPPGEPPSEGMYYVWYRFADRTYDEVTNTLGPVTKMFDLEYDKANPSLTISSLSENTVTYLQSPSHILQGSVSDSYGIKSFTYSINEQTPKSLGSFDGSQKDWPEFNSTGDEITLPAGDNTIVFTLTDKAGKETQTTRKVFVDTEQPKIEITSITPAIDAVDDKGTPDKVDDETFFKINGIVTVKGTFSDDDKINSDTITIAPQAQIDNETVIISKQNSSAFEVKIDTTKMNEADLLSSVFNLSAQDRSGKTAAVTGMNLASYKVDQESDRPVITDANFNTGVATAAGVNKDTNLFSASQKFTAAISDDDGIAKVEVIVNAGLPAEQTLELTVDNKRTYNMSVPVSDLASKGLSDTPTPLQIVVTDSELGVIYSTAVFYAARDAGAPTISVTSYDDTTPTEGYDNDGVYTNLGFLTESKTISGTETGTENTLGIVSTSSIGSSLLGTKDTNLPGWSFVINNSPSDSAAEIISITATDRYGRNVIKRFSYIFDRDKPTISISTPKSTYFKPSEGVTLSGFAYEAEGSSVTQSGLAGTIEYIVLTGTDTALPALPATPDWIPIPVTTPGSWQIAVPSTSFSNDGSYTIYFRSKDKGGNYADPAYEVVYGDSDTPQITTLIGLDESDDATRPVYTLNGNFSIDVTLKENSFDDIGMSQWYYQKYYTSYTGDYPESAAIINFDVDIMGTTWNIEEINPQDGKYKYVITASDYAGNETVVTREVIVEDNPPVVTLSTPVSTTWYGTSTIDLKGNATDGTGSGIKDFGYRIAAGAPGAEPVIDPDTKLPADFDTWSKFTLAEFNGSTINASIKADKEGVNTLWLFISDAAGNYSLAGYEFKVDTEAPVLGITGGTTTRNLTTTDTGIVFSGTATDTALLSTVTIALNGTVVQTINAPLLDDAWAATAIPKEALNANSGNLVEITATDAYGRTDIEKVTVNYDTLAPVTTIANVTPVITYTDVLDVVHSNCVNGTITVSGTLSDATGVEGYRYVLASSKGGSPMTTNVSGPATNFTFTIDTADLDFDGDSTPDDNFTLTLTVTAYDAAGNESSASRALYAAQASDNPVVAYSNLTTGGTAQNNLYDKTSNNKILGTLTDDDGLLNVDILIDSVQTTVFNADALNNTTSRAFSYDVSGLTEGTHTIAFVLTDKNGLEVTTAPEHFAVDAANPVITVTTAQNTFKTPNSPVTITGTASDGNGFTSIQDVADAADVDLTTGTLATKGSNVVWEYEFTTPAPTGSYTRVLRAIDAYGKETDVSFTYSVDSSIPTVVPSWPAAHTDTNIYIDGTKPFAFSGLADDTGEGQSGLSKVYYALTSGAASTAPATSPFSADWKEMAGTAEWNTSITTAVSGVYTLHVIAKDNAGNFSTVAANTVYIDQSSPVFSSISLTEGVTAYKNGDFSITGIVTDTYLDTLTYTRTKNGTADISSMPIAASTGTTWTLSQTGFTPDTLATYVYTFTAKDKSGKTATFTRTVTVDTKVPEAELTSVTPIVGANKVNGEIAIKGAISDNDKVQTGTYTLQVKDGVGDYQNVAGFVDVSLGANLNNWTFTINTTAAGFTDNRDLKITINTTDRAGNTDTLFQEVNIDQSTDNPVVAYSNLTSGGTAGDNLFGTLSNNKILGTFTDDDGLTNVNVVIDGDATPDLFLDAAALNNTTSSAFTYDVSGLTEGVHTIAFVLTDKNGRSVTTSAESFAVDAADPVIAVTTQQNSFLPASTKVTVTGTASDGNGFTSIVDTTTTTPVTLTTGSLTDKVSTIEWSYTFDTPSVTGPASRSFTATDAFGKVSTVVFNYKVDATAPGLTVTSWPSSDYVNLPDNDIYRVKGNASDEVGGSGLNDVRYIVKAGDVAAPDAADPDWKSAAGLNPWTANVDMSNKASGVYSLYIMARDTAGNSSVTVKKLIYADLQAPSLTDIVVSTSTVFNTDFIIRGNASDPDGYLQKVTAHYTGLATPAELTLTGAAWSYTVPVTTPLAEGNYTLTITAFDQSGKTFPYTKSFTVDRTAPAISYSNINEAGTTSLTETSPKVYGSLSDANGMTTATVLFRKYNGSIFEAPAGHTAVTVTGFTENSKSLNFTLDMSTILGDLLTDGVWQAEITSTDLTANSRTVTSANFRVDRNNPTVSVPKIFIGGTEVTNGFVTSGVNYTVSGTMSDGDGGIKSVEVQLKHNNTIIPINSHDREPAILSGGTWTVDIGSVFTSTGSYDLIVIATDLAGRTKEEKLVLQCDITPPEIRFIAPFALDAVQPATLIGNITISGKSIDNAMNKTWYAVGGSRSDDSIQQFISAAPITWTEFLGNYDWSASINTTPAANEEFSTRVGAAPSTIWILPVHIKAMDVSGNISYATLNITIDTDIDKPVADILSPDNEETVGGQFSISGSAHDDNSIHSIYMQVEVVGAEYISNEITGFAGSEVTDGLDAAQKVQTRYFTKIGDDPSAWYKVIGTTGWNFTLNKLKELNKESLKAAGVIFTPEENDLETTTKLIIRVKAYDTKTPGMISNSIFGYYDEITLTLQSGAPSILIDDMPEPNKYISGTVNTNFTVTDDEGIESVNISIGGNNKTINYSAVSSTPTVIEGYTVEGSDPNTIGATTYYKTWKVTDTWNTTTITAPSVVVTIEATDYSLSSPKTTTNNRTVYIDNTPPVFNYHTDNTKIKGEVDRADITDPIAMIGSAAGLYGDTTDNGSGINKVILYFTQDDGASKKFFSMGGLTAAGGVDEDGEVISHQIVINGISQPFPEANLAAIELGKTAGIPQKYIVIDKAEGGRDSSEVGDDDGYNEQMSASGTWYVKTDSNNLKDGFYDVHCVIVDNAGNLNYEKTTMLVQNNKPIITSIDLFTDINMSGGIDVADAFTNILVANLSTAESFKVRNNQFQLRINTDVNNNGGLIYTLTGPTGNVITPSTPDHFTLTNLGSDGIKDFRVSVKDTFGISSTEYLFKITYENTDGENPKTELFDLNTIIAKGANVNTGSISQDGGHVEPRGLSIYNGDDPDVSGKIILRGKASDNQRLKNVNLTLGSETVTVLTWDGSTMGPAANVVSETLGVEGHVVEWAYVWDTSTVQDSSGIVHALLNTEVSVHAEDASSLPSIGDPLPDTYNTMTIDVMPYITKVTTGLSVIKKNNPSIFNRTTLGHYPVNSIEEIEITGFNLSTAQINGATTNITSNNGTVLKYDIDVNHTITTDDPASGILNLTVNSIPLLNNVNDNTVATNCTPNGENNDLLTDDVYLDIWNIDSDAVKSVGGAIKEPVMKVNPDTDAGGRVGFAFANGVDTFSMANGTTNSYTQWMKNYADWGKVAFGFDVNGVSHGIVIGFDTAPSAGYGGRMNYITSKWGIPHLYQADNFAFYRKLRMESCGIPATTGTAPDRAPLVNGQETARVIDITRFQSPSMAIASSSTRTDPTMYLAYYDNMQKQIRFRWGTNSVNARNTNPAQTATGFNQFYDEDTNANRDNATLNDDAYGDHIVFEAQEANYSLIAGNRNQDADTVRGTGNTAGQYVALDVITGGNANADIVTIVWYDGADLWYTARFGTKDDTNADAAGVTDKWTEPVKIFTGAGIDCAIAVDDAVTPGIHIAGYDRINGALRYAYLSSYTDRTPDTCVVDDYDIVGTKISITTVIKDYDHDNNPSTPALNGVVPYISYYMASTQRPKLAYLIDPLTNRAPNGVDESTAFTGAWEITLIPTTSIVNEDRINVDFWRNTNGTIKNSTYTANTGTNQTGYVYGNGTANPILGYAVTVVTDGFIETAQMK